eukprot:jgi/Mesen1/6280/ME000324S05323
MAAASREQSDYADTTEKIIVAVEDEWNIWPLVKPTFEARLPLRKAVLHNKAKKPVEIERLPIEYITSTDPRLRSRPPAKNSPHWFRHPYCTLILVPCEDADDYRQNVRPKLQVLVKNEWREFLLVHIPRTPQTEASAKLAAKVYARMCDHFRKDRCCKLDIFTPDPGGWAEMETRVVEAVRNTLDIRVTHYDAEVRRLSEHRHAPDWNFCSFFVDKESLAFMLEMAQLRDDALREYDELELMRLGDLIGYGKAIVRTPCNSKLTAPWRELQLAPRHLLHAANKRRAAQEAAPSGDLWAAPEKLSHGERRYPSPPARTASGRVTIDDVEAELASGGKPSPPAAPRAPAEPPANKQAPPRSASRHPVHSREAPTLTNAASKALSLPEIQASAELALEQTVSHRGLRSALASIQSFEDTISLETSAILTFAASATPPLELCEGDPGGLQVTIWSGLPEELALDALTLTLVKAAEGGAVLQPGKNLVPMRLTAQGKGAYVPAVLTAVLGKARLRSSAASISGGPPDADDHLSVERPFRPVVRVAPARQLVEISPAVAWGLLVGHTQWLGLLIQPLSYSLKGALLRIIPGPGLTIQQPQLAEMELFVPPGGSSEEQQAGGGSGVAAPESPAHRPAARQVAPSDGAAAAPHVQFSADTRAGRGEVPPGGGAEGAAAREGSGGTEEQDDATCAKREGPEGSPVGRQRVELRDGELALPDWAADKPTVLWLQVAARRDRQDISLSPQATSPQAMTPASVPVLHSPGAVPLTPFMPAGAQQRGFPPHTPPSAGGSSLGGSGEREGNDPASSASSQVSVSPMENAPSGRPSWFTAPRSAVEGQRVVDVKLEFGPNRARLYDRQLGVQFTEPFQALTREDEAPPGSSSRRQLSKQPPTLDVSSLRRRHLNSVLRVKYRLGGDRTVGAHPPPSQDQDQDRHLGGSGEVSSDDRSSSAARGSGDGAAVDSSRKGIKRGGSATGVGGKGKDEEHEEDGGEGLQEGEEGRGEEGEKESERGGQQLCTFVHTFAMQAPMMERHLAVGMLAMPARPPRVGEAVLLQWRVERLIPGCASAGTAAPPSRTQPEELDFEVKLNPDHWMAAGRKKGFLLLPQEEGARAHVSIACLPLVAGHVHPPALRLPHVNKGHVSHNPPAPHLICVYPPAQCMSFCVSKLV